MAVLLNNYAQRIDALCKELGIPQNYAAERRLPLHIEAHELVTAGLDDTGRDCLLIPAAAEAWRAMRTRARTFEIELIPLSGFRSVERQTEIIRGKLALGERIEDILHSIAAPGYSEHHTGRAVDVGSPEVPPLEEAFASTRAFAWLARYADDYGFHLSFPKHNTHGFVYEPWHWCWHGRRMTPSD